MVSTKKVFKTITSNMMSIIYFYVNIHKNFNSLSLKSYHPDVCNDITVNLNVMKQK